MSHRAKIMESIQRAEKELVSALASIDHLPDVDRDGIAFTSHALNNYLSVCSGTIDILKDMLSDHEDPEVPVMLNILRHSTDLMSHSVCRLVYGSNGRPPALSYSPVNLTRLMERITEFYSNLASEKPVEILFAPTLQPVQVWTDRVAVSAILDNFLSNAVKYSSPGSRVWVRLEKQADFAVCSVRDEGPGLSLEDQRKIFQRGTKLTPRPTAGEPSTGYGLSVAKELTELLGGEISCESKLGAGTTFSLRLPLEKP